MCAEWLSPEPAVLFYTTNDAAAASQVERLIKLAGFEPAQAGGVRDSLRIEVGGDLHAFGGLNGRVVERQEAESLVRASNGDHRDSRQFHGRKLLLAGSFPFGAPLSVPSPAPNSEIRFVGSAELS